MASGMRSQLTGVFHYTATSLERTDTSVLPRLREEVWGKPEHPKRSLIKRLERVEKFGPEVRRQTLWLMGDSARLNREPLWPDSADFFDVCTLPDSGWRLSPGQAVLTGPMGSEPPGYQVVVPIGSAVNEILSFWGAGWAALGSFEGPHEFQSLEGGAWRASVSSDKGSLRTTTVLEGEYNPQTGHGRIISMRATQEGSPAPGWVETASDWRFDAALQRELAHQVVVHFKGAPFRRLTLDRVEPLTRAEFDRISRPPSLTGSDPIRGKYVFTQLSDFSGSDTEHTLINKNTGAIQDVIHERRTDPFAGKRSAWFTPAAWAAVASISAALVYLRLARRFA